MPTNFRVKPRGSTKSYSVKVPYTVAPARRAPGTKLASVQRRRA